MDQDQSFQDLIKSMKRPQGSFGATLTKMRTKEIFDKTISHIILFEEATGNGQPEY